MEETHDQREARHDREHLQRTSFWNGFMVAAFIGSILLVALWHWLGGGSFEDSAPWP